MAESAIDDRTTADEVWRDFGASLRQFVGRRVRNPDDADEIVQEIFLRLHSHIDEIEEPTGWIYRAARNSIVDFYRSARRRREVPSDSTVVMELLPPLDEVTEDEDVWQEFVGCVDPLLRDLSDVDRQALSLVDLEGQTQAEVADELGLSVSGMKSRVQRARQRVRAALDDCCVIELDARGIPLGMTRREHDGTSCACGPADDATSTDT